MKKVYLEGRPPWFKGSSIKEPLVIGVTGGSGSGKTSVCQYAVYFMFTKGPLLKKWVCNGYHLLAWIIFIRDLVLMITRQLMILTILVLFIFVFILDAFDFDLLMETIFRLKQGKSVTIPYYDFTTHSRLEEFDTKVYGADVIIIEGLLVLYDERIRGLLDIKLFVDTEDDVRLMRRCLWCFFG